jgi:Arc/MetJ-type ribon-helix-helix transcriptional regulator
MSQPKEKRVFTAEPSQLEQIQVAVRSGRFQSASQFLREAINEKLEKLRRERLAEQVERYCNEGHSNENAHFIEKQAFDRDE